MVIPFTTDLNLLNTIGFFAGYTDRDTTKPAEVLREYSSMCCTTQLIFYVKRDGHLGQIKIRGIVPVNGEVRVVQQVLTTHHWKHVLCELPRPIRRMILLFGDLSVANWRSFGDDGPREPHDEGCKVAGPGVVA